MPLITMDLQKMGRALLGALSGLHCLGEKSKVLSTTLQVCCDLAPCDPSSPSPSWCITPGASRSCFCILAPAAPQSDTPPLMLCFLTSCLAFEIQTKRRCLCLSRHFMPPCFSVWLATHFSPVDCNLLEHRDGLTLSSLWCHTPDGATHASLAASFQTCSHSTPYASLSCFLHSMHLHVTSCTYVSCSLSVSPCLPLE